MKAAGALALTPRPMSAEDKDSARLRAALREADWEKLLPGLIAYAAGRLRRVGWAAGRDVEPSKLSVEQLVNSAVLGCLDGSRRWDPEAVDLAGFLRGVIRSLASSEKKKAVRAKTDARGDLTLGSVGGMHGDASGAQLIRIQDSAESELVREEGRRAILRSIEACIDGDDDLRALYRVVIEEGATKRDEIARLLGWSPSRVTAARIKLQRRLVRHAPDTFSPPRRDGERRAKKP